MTSEEWETIRKNGDDLRSERDQLRRLLNEALAFVPTHTLTWAASRKALGLTGQSSCMEEGEG